MRSGDRLAGRYRLVEAVASGGMGSVWKGHDDRLDRVVAIKVLHASLSNDDVFQRRFHTEARAVAALQAPGVVNVFDYGEEASDDGPVIYIIMEFVEGRSLQDVLIEDGTIDPAESMRIIAGSARALHAAHQAGIIHRDIKPGNILIDKHGDPRIVDFGIARTDGDAGLTSTGMVMGTVSYVAPEQLRGDEPSPAADIYSLGVVAYQCLAGRKPYNSDTPASIIASTLNDPPPPMPEDIPENFAAIVLRALEKDPADRWPTAAAFADACRGRGDTGAVAASEETTAVVRAREAAAAKPPPTDSTPPEVSPGRGRHRLGLVLLIVLALAALTGTGFVASSWYDHPKHDKAGGGSSSAESSADHKS
ncbi:MAG TPA: serine/threonine-protein kinase, partial [Stackebrandtia sp.]|uniref:serine/threonine-protein kinase n=1 Tax=Stackebrandtia sp. TaxID=2023065 RepID=UPI002D44356D